jgi:hypothetical protein
MILNEQTIVVVRDDSSGSLGRLSHGVGPGTRECVAERISAGQSQPGCFPEPGHGDGFREQPGIGFEAGRGLDTAGTVMFDIRFLRPTRLHNE